MRIGWATPSFNAGKLLGSDCHSYAYDGHLVSSKIRCNLSRSCLGFFYSLGSGTTSRRISAAGGVQGTLWDAC